MLRFLKSLFRSQVLVGSIGILAFCAALGLVMLLLSWPYYRDQYGVGLADFFKFVF